jgi:hypothetical protein
MYQRLFIVNILFGLARVLVSQEQNEPKLPSITEIRNNLGRVEGAGRGLAEFGARLYPSFEVILNDPTVQDREAGLIVGLLRNTNGDRRRFVRHAVR